MEKLEVATIVNQNNSQEITNFTVFVFMRKENAHSMTQLIQTLSDESSVRVCDSHRSKRPVAFIHKLFRLRDNTNFRFLCRLLHVIGNLDSTVIQLLCFFHLSS